MAIYTWTGSPVEITEARLVPVWVEKRPGQVKWHYAKPKKPRGKINEVPMWHYRGRYAGEAAARICDGKWVNANGLRADGGWQEIDAKLIELCPEGPTKYKLWNRADGPAASALFGRIDPKEAA